MKRILTVQDISCVGKCSLSVALPIISAMGVETCVLPTAVLSSHTAFSDFTFRDLTSDIPQITAQWKKNQLHFDAIYTGYLGSLNQIDLIRTLLRDFAENDTLKIIDPCMADNGTLYTGFSGDFVKSMADLCDNADVIVPNLTEAHLLLGLPYKETGYTQSDIEIMLKELAALGAKKVVLKGIHFDDKKIGIATYDSFRDDVSWYFHKRIPQNFHGTGDIFASVLTGALVKGLPLPHATGLAADFVLQSILKTLEKPDWNWYGVDFEEAIPYLVQRIGDV